MGFPAHYDTYRYGGNEKGLWNYTACKSRDKETGYSREFDGYRHKRNKESKEAL